MATTRERLKALHREKPHLNQTELAEALGVTRQRVSELAKAQGLKLKKGPTGLAGRASRVEEASAVESVVPRGTTPAVAILLTAADLTRRGYTVFVPITPDPKVDMVAIDQDNNVERIVVRRGKRAGKDIRYDDPDRGGATRRALLLTDEPIRYQPSLHDYDPLDDSTKRGPMSEHEHNPLESSED